MNKNLLASLIILSGALPTALQAAFAAGANDFASAPLIPVKGEPSSQITDLFGYSFENGENSHNPQNPSNFSGGTGGRSAWWKWTPEVNGLCSVDTTFTLTLSSGNSPVTDTVLSVYTGTAVNNLTRVAANNQHGHYSNNADANLAKVSFYAVAGTTYYIAVDGGYSGEITSTRRNVILRLQQLPAKALTRRSLWSMDRTNTSLQGMITVTTTAAGSYSAVLQAGGTQYRFTGLFDSDGTSRRSISRAVPKGALPVPPIVVTLDGRGDGSYIIEIDNAYETGQLPAQLVFPKTAPAGVAGVFNLASRDEFINTASARGYLRMTVSASGSVAVAGVAMDGTTLTFSSALMEQRSSSEFLVLAYLSLHKGKGSFTLDATAYTGATDAEDFVEASTDYLRPAAPTSTLLPAGITLDEYMVGYAYPKPTLNTRALGFLNPGGFGQLVIYEAGGEMANRITENVTLSTANKFTFASLVKKPSLKLNPATGLVTGSITTTDTIQGVTKARARTIRGILFKDDNGDTHIYGHATGITTPLMMAVLPSTSME
jgi:hypothetical protein